MIPEHIANAMDYRPLAFDDLESIPDSRYRYEILQGELIVSEPPGTLHQRILRKLLLMLDDSVKDAKIGEVIPGPFAVELTRTDVVSPDMIVVHHEQQDQLTERRFLGAPYLVIEVVCPESAHVDYIRKAATYTKACVPEYWIIDPYKQKVLDYRSTSTGATRGRYAAGKVSSAIVPGFSFQLDQLFSG